MSEIACRIWCDRASYLVKGHVSEVEKVLTWALSPGENRAPFVYFDNARRKGQVVINANKVAAVELAIAE